MSNSAVTRAIEDWLRSPSLDRFLHAQTMVTTSVDYEPSAATITSLENQLSPVLSGETVEKLAETLVGLPKEFQFCPRFHYVHARICEARNESVQAQEAVLRLQTCLRGILETGEGTNEAPFKVTFLTDTDDLVRALGESVRCQQLVATSDGYCDVLTTHAGNDFWFDIESLLERSSVEALTNRLVAAK